VGRVASAIPADGALLEMIAYMDRPVAPKPGVPRSKLPPQFRYLALVLFQDGRTSTADHRPPTEEQYRALIVGRSSSGPSPRCSRTWWNCWANSASGPPSYSIWPGEAWIRTWQVLGLRSG